MHQTRLAQLQKMSYEEYVETPEWHHRRNAALKAAGYHCQMCQQSGVHLEVHHTTDKHFGSEQEADLVVLCDTCFERLAVPETQASLLSFGQKAMIFGATASMSTVGLEGILHAPLPLEVAALVGAYVLARKSPQLYAHVKNHLPDPVRRLMEKATERKEGQWSWWDKFAHARHLQGDPVPEDLKDQDQDEESLALPPVFPRYRDDETLRLGQMIDNETLAILSSAYQQDPSKRLPKVQGARFEPHINDLFGKGMIIAAVQGAGKSMLIGLVVEQLGECDGPAIVFDHKGEYPGIAELASLCGLLAGGPAARKQAERLGVPFFELSTKNADAFVEKVLTNHHQAIVLLPSYGTAWIERARIVAEVGQALMRYSEKQRQEEKKLLPCLVVLDEAQLYIPQNVNLLPPEAQRNRDVLDSLSNAFFALVSNGRSNGYTMCFATQSLTYIAKWAIKSSQIRVIMRHVEYNDLEMIEKIIGKSEVATRSEVETMPPGVGIVFGFTPKPMLVQFDRRQSRDLSETPGIDRLRRDQQDDAWGNDDDDAPRGRATVKVGDLTLDELITLVNRQVHATKEQEQAEQEQDTDELEDLDVTVTTIQDAQNSPKFPDFGRDGHARDGRDGGHKAAPQQGGTPQNGTVTVDEELPIGWTGKKLDLLPGFYRVLGNLDKSLDAIEVSITQRNRDFAREVLKQHGLWKG